ncbi:TMEM175 family protein [Streptomyces fructofermentans]|uniref:TMEM175 family protein n=1 Tax=Streptomyces fructofermentans TaxID=152141 RepID=UPI0037B26A5A
MRRPRPAGGPERLTTFSDGVYAIAMTLLVLDVSVPPDLDDAGFHTALRGLVPNLGAYALSFVVLVGFWRDHHRIFRIVRQIDSTVVTLCMFGLGVTALLPFPTTLVSEYGRDPASVAIYSAAVAALSTAHLGLLVVLRRRPWLRTEEPMPEGVWFAADLGSTAVVFLLSVPAALVFGPGVMWAWLGLIPLKTYLGRRTRFPDTDTYAGAPNDRG